MHLRNMLLMDGLRSPEDGAGDGAAPAPAAAEPAAAPEPAPAPVAPGVNAAPVVPEPTPAPASAPVAASPAPAPAAAPAPAPSPDVPDYEALHKAAAERTQAALAQTEALNRQLEARIQAAKDKDRLDFLKKRGLLATVAGDSVLQWSPDVDTNTPEGRAQLDQWCAAQPHFFAVRTNPAVPTIDEVLSSVPEARRQSPNGLYDQRYLTELLKQNGI